MLTHHPANRLLRYVLEIVGLVSIGQWGWNYSSSWQKYAVAIGIPFILAIAWITLTTPEDPGRNSKSIIAVPGMIRLGYELILVILVILVLLSHHQILLAGFYLFATLLHVFWSFDRIVWLSRN